MPIYEYECQKCGHLHEALQKISEDPLTVCPACNASALKKLVSAAGFRLSGSGWYETDFKSSNKKNLSKGDSDSSSSSSSASGGCSGSCASKPASNASS
jgi:putative FmdB family regulatory protein